tara:strand:- start:85 stop:582 length:498 start_codon:yes stop_codon:yes gene_type:complete
MNNKIIGMYPGSFDPITNGHIDIIIRSLKIVNKLIVAIVNNNSKKPLFTSNQRKLMIQKEIIKINKNLMKKIKILEFNGLLTNFAMKNNVTCIIRGLRAVSDFEYEFQMTGMNKNLFPELETIFLMSSEKYSFISSKLVKEVHKLGGNVDKFVSKDIVKKLNKKI